MEEFNTDKYLFEQYMYNAYHKDTYIRTTKTGYEISDWGNLNSPLSLPVQIKIPKMEIDEIVPYIKENHPELFL